MILLLQACWVIAYVHVDHSPLQVRAWQAATSAAVCAGVQIYNVLAQGCEG